MAFSKIKNVKISGLAACVPKNTVLNKDYPLFDNEEYQRFISSVGIEKKRIVEPGVCTSDLCFSAAEKLIADIGWDKSQIEVIVFVSHTTDYKLPSTACILQDRLKITDQCMAFDVTLGCSGYTHGLKIMASILSGGGMKKGLLLAGNTQSLYASYEDKSVYPLFADAGTATAMEYVENDEEICFHFGSDGSGFDAIIVPDGGCRNPVTPKSFEIIDYGEGMKRSNLHEGLDGMEVFSFGIKRAPQSVNQLVDFFGLDKETIDYFLFHQANHFMVERIRKKLKIPAEKVPYNIKDFGNTSCATIPLLMVTNLQKDLTTKTLNLLLCGFGVGLSWGSAALSIHKIVCSDLIEI